MANLQKTLSALSEGIAPPTIRKGTLVAISGNRCSVTFDGVVVIKGIPVVGNAAILTVGKEVIVEYIHNRPVVLSGGTVETTRGGSVTLAQVAASSTNVILSTAADEILELGGAQILDLDLQNANTVFKGPDSGGAAKPTFAALVAEDLAAIQEGPDIDIVDAAGVKYIGRAGDSILLFDRGAGVLREYAGTSAGLDAASAVAAAGDVVWVPTVIIPGDHVLTAAVHYIGISRYASQLTGLITGGAGTTLECITIERTANDANILRGIVGPATGTMKICSCDIFTTQSGTGNSYAVCSEAGGDVEAWLCDIDGQSVGGIGYGSFRAGVGSLTIQAGRCNGSSYPCSE